MCMLDYCRCHDQTIEPEFCSTCGCGMDRLIRDIEAAAERLRGALVALYRATAACTGACGGLRNSAAAVEALRLINETGGLPDAPPVSCSHEWDQSIEDAIESGRPIYCLKCGACGDV